MDEMSELRVRITALEQKMDFLLQSLGLDSKITPNLPTALQTEVANLLREGQKILAIKLYLEQTGVGLKEAKEAVDVIEKQMR